jgi:hypothetical protein
VSSFFVPDYQQQAAYATSYPSSYSHGSTRDAGIVHPFRHTTQQQQHDPLACAQLAVGDLNTTVADSNSGAFLNDVDIDKLVREMFGNPPIS